MKDIYKIMWKKFKKKYGNEYIIFEGGDSVEQVMDEFEDKYLKDDDIEEIKYHNPIYIPFTKIRIL